MQWPNGIWGCHVHHGAVSMGVKLGIGYEYQLPPDHEGSEGGYSYDSQFSSYHPAVWN